MDLKTFNKNRVCFVLQGCPHCRMIVGDIELINFKLSVNKRIKIIDCTLYQNYGIVTDPIILLYSKHFDGYPTSFIGNIKISGSNSRFEYYTYIHDLLEEEFYVPESSEHKFYKECEIKNKGLFKGSLVCK